MMYLVLAPEILGDLLCPPQGKREFYCQSVPYGRPDQAEYWGKVQTAAASGQLFTVWSSNRGPGRSFPADSPEEYQSLLERSQAGEEAEMEQQLQALAKEGVLICRGELLEVCRSLRNEVIRLRAGREPNRRKAELHPDPADAWKDNITELGQELPPPPPDELVRYPGQGDELVLVTFLCAFPNEAADEQADSSQEGDQDAQILSAVRDSMFRALYEPWKMKVVEAEISAFISIL